MEHKPIKRSGYLISLSRDHHAGLLFCWKIKEGLKKDVSTDRIDNYSRFFWETHLKEHFLHEEILLFNQLTGDLTSRAKTEHRLLTAWFREITTGGSVGERDYLVFTKQLTDHIRFEERELFPYLETALPPETLAGIREILTRLHQMSAGDDYSDEFWLT